MLTSERQEIRSGVHDVVVVPLAKDRDPAGWERRRRRLGLLLAAAIPVSFFALWQVASEFGWVDPRTFSSPFGVLGRTVEMVRSGLLIEHVVVTLRKVVLGYAAGAAMGVLFGLTVGWSDLVRRAVRPSISALYTVPKLGVFPLLLLVFGLGETPQIILVVISVFLIVVLGTIDAVDQIPRMYMDAARSLNASRLTTFFEVIVPSSLSRIFTSLRLAVGLAILVIIGAEMVSSNVGIGYLLWSGWTLFRADDMFVGIIVSAALGVAATSLIWLVERILTPWPTGRD